MNSHLTPFPGALRAAVQSILLSGLSATEIILPYSFRSWLEFQTRGNMFLRRKKRGGRLFCLSGCRQMTVWWACRIYQADAFVPGFISPVPKDAPSLCQKALLQGMAPPVAGNKEVACGPVCRADQAPGSSTPERPVNSDRKKQKQNIKPNTSVNRQEVSWLESSSSDRMAQ